MDNINDWLIPLLTFLGTIFAGTGLKWVEGWLKKTKDEDDIATNLRKELRAELTELKLEIKRTEDQLDEWKAKYYEIIEKFIAVRTQLEYAKQMLERNGQVLPPVSLTDRDTSTTLNATEQK